MKKIFLIVAFAGILTSCTKSNYTISGEIQGFEDGTMVYLNTIGDNELVKKDSTEIKENVFQFKGNTEDIEYAFIQIGNSEGQPPFNIPMILESGEIKITADKQDPSQTKVTGTKNNEDLNKYNEMAASYTKKIQEFQRANDAKFKEASEKNDSQTVQQLLDQNDALRKEMVDATSQFIDNHKDSYVSLLLLNQYGEEFGSENYATKYNNLALTIKQTKLGKEIAQELKNLEATSIGQKAPDFTAKSPEGADVSLYQNLGKVTIIDFWASWCGPCRIENPNVVKLYNQYRDKGLQIIGVSLDKDADKWKKAIADDQLSWIHLSHLKMWDDPIAKQYNIRAIPATLILDQNGVIVAKNLRGEELESKIAELLK